jgi:hypothetical protein
MHNLLTKWLEKRGVKSPDELDNTPMPDGSPTELEVFNEYKAGLAKQDLTLEDLKNYCLAQISVIESKWADYSIDDSKKSQLIPYHTVYKTLINVIDGPVAVRTAMEKQLEKLTQ